MPLPFIAVGASLIDKKFLIRTTILGGGAFIISKVFFHELEKAKTKGVEEGIANASLEFEKKYNDQENEFEKRLKKAKEDAKREVAQREAYWEKEVEKVKDIATGIAKEASYLFGLAMGCIEGMMKNGEVPHAETIESCGKLGKIIDGFVKRQDALGEDLHNLDYDSSARMDIIFADVENVIEETRRVASLAYRAPIILEDLDNEFEKKTQLNKIDIAFLLLVTALQCVRQYILANDKFRLEKASDGDKLMTKVAPKSLDEILLGPVPYDAIKGSSNFDAGLGGNTHRYRTLGHDPIMGWVFGPLNILSDSLTKYTVWESYSVQNMTLISQIPTSHVFRDAFEQIKVDKYNLPVAVARQAIHFGSDYFTKQGLPLPFISIVNNDIAKILIRDFNIDMWSVTRGIGVAVLINSLASCIHQLFYDKHVHGSRKLYEVKTRKILQYSNIIASTSNILKTTIDASLGNVNSLKVLDVGGFSVALYRLISDTKFIYQVKREFIMESFDEMIRGKECDLE